MLTQECVDVNTVNFTKSVTSRISTQLIFAKHMSGMFGSASSLNIVTPSMRFKHTRLTSTSNTVLFDVYD